MTVDRPLGSICRIALAVLDSLVQTFGMHICLDLAKVNPSTQREITFCIIRIPALSGEKFPAPMQAFVTTEVMNFNGIVSCFTVKLEQLLQKRTHILSFHQRYGSIGGDIASDRRNFAVHRVQHGSVLDTML